MLLEVLSGFELGALITPIWRKYISRKDTKDILLYGTIQPKSIPIVDGILVKQMGELSYLQRLSRDKLIGIIRAAVNTKAFELVLGKMIKDRWVLDKQLRME